MIVKVQQSIEPAGRVLIYNEAMTLCVEITDPEQVAFVRKMIGEHTLKAYCKARWNKAKKTIELKHVVRAQGW